jgi:hypothetical protein
VNKLKSSIQHDYDCKLAEFKGQLEATDRINNERWIMKRDIFLRTLKFVDGWWSNMEWQPHLAQKQDRPTIEEAREIHNQISLICESDVVLNAFRICLRMAEHDEKSPDLNMGAIGDLRNAMRTELKFSEQLSEKQQASWILEMKR